MRNNVLRVLLAGYLLEFLSGALLGLAHIAPHAHASLIWSLTAGGGWELALHTYLGLALSALAIGLYSLNRHNLASGIIALTTVGAFLNGLSLISFPKMLSSAIMGGCWLVSIVLVSALLLRQAKTANVHATQS